MTWDDVGEHFLVVDKSWSYGKLKRTKTSNARSVEIIQPLADDFDAYRPARPERGALAIPATDGGYLSIGNWRNREWWKATERTGITATPYTLRRSYGSMLVHQGVSVPMVAAAMGHSRPSTTLDVYSHEYAAHRLRWGVDMVESITAARRGVRNTCATTPPRRLCQAAP